MRWSKKSAERFIGWPLAVLLSPILIPFVAFLILAIKAEDLVRIVAAKFAHPTHAHRYFAWKPVEMSLWSDHSGEWRWMETVWRGRNQWGETVMAPTIESLEKAL